jgi:hypothetical protein
VFLRNLCRCAFAVTNRGSGTQRRPLGDFQVSAALVPPQPAENDGALDTGAKLLATAASRQKWLIDAFDEDTGHPSPPAVRDLDDPARGGVGIGEGLPLDEFHAAIVISHESVCGPMAKCGAVGFTAAIGRIAEVTWTSRNRRD